MNYGVLALLAAMVVGWWLFRRRGGVAPRDGAAGADPRLPAGPGGPAEADRGMTDPLLRRVYLLLHEITQVSPEVTRPEHLMGLPGYREAVQLLSDGKVPNELLFDLVQGERLYPALAALDALATRPREEELEALLYAQLDRFHPWSCDGLLRVLEAWHPDDPLLAGRVLVRLDRLWAGTGHAVALERFLRRRAAKAPLTLEGVELPKPERAEELLEGVLPEQDAALVEPFIAPLKSVMEKAGRAAAGPGSRDTGRCPTRRAPAISRASASGTSAARCPSRPSTLRPRWTRASSASSRRSPRSRRARCWSWASRGSARPRSRAASRRTSRSRAGACTRRAHRS